MPRSLLQTIAFIEEKGEVREKGGQGHVGGGSSSPTGQRKAHFRVGYDVCRNAWRQLPPLTREPTTPVRA